MSAGEEDVQMARSHRESEAAQEDEEAAQVSQQGSGPGAEDVHMLGTTPPSSSGMQHLTAAADDRSSLRQASSCHCQQDTTAPVAWVVCPRTVRAHLQQQSQSHKCSSQVCRHSIAAKNFSCSVQLKESCLSHGWNHIVTLGDTYVTYCAGPAHLPDRWWHREPPVHVAKHGGHLQPLHPHLPALHPPAQGVCLRVCGQHWAEALLCGWRQRH